MEECMRECMRKLALWHTRTFKPIMTHDELEPIMATLGFVALPPAPSSSPVISGGTAAALWKGYVYSAGGYQSGSSPESLPRPRLPYPRIDGLHIYTYRAFIDALTFYLPMTDVSDLFHISWCACLVIVTLCFKSHYPEAFQSLMAALRTALLYLVLLHMWRITAREDDWKSGTATYTKDTEASIITEGACGYGELHKMSYGKYSAGLSTMLFNRGSSCGGCFEVRCVDHILWCLQGSPSVILTATDFCPPNYGLPADYGGWCNFPKQHFEMSESAFAQIANARADMVPVQYRRVTCERRGGIRFTLSGSNHFYQVLISNVGLDGEVVAVKVKGSKTGWMTMARNWGQNWHCNINLEGQPLSFEVTTTTGITLTAYNVAPPNWQFGQTFEGKQFRN